MRVGPEGLRSSKHGLLGSPPPLSRLLTGLPHCLAHCLLAGADHLLAYSGWVLLLWVGSAPLGGFCSSEWVLLL